MSEQESPKIIRARARAATVAWDLSCDPTLLAAVLQQEPWLQTRLDRLRERPLCATVTTSFKRGRYVRLEQHNRAFYYLDATGSALAFKGTELLARDRVQAFERLRWHSPLRTSTLELLPRFEQKVPFALLLDEALGEATSAHEFQRAYFTRYGEFAAVPIPLLVHRWSDEVVGRFVDALCPHLTHRTAAIVRRLCAGGLGTYVYLYPNPPIRAQHLADALPSIDEGYAARASALRERVSLEHTIRSWATLLARMFGLGFLPCNLSHDEIGQCVRGQNAVLDGGFVDVDSLTKITDLTDDALFTETLLVTLFELLDTAHTLWVRYNRPSTFWEQRTGTVTMLLVWQFLVSELRDAITREEEAGVSFDPRITSVLSDRVPFDTIERNLALLHPPQKEGPRVRFQ